MAAIPLYQTITPVGTELVEFWGVPGAPHEYATSKAVAALALSGQGAAATVAATSGAATKAGNRVVVTSESLTTAAGSDYTLTLTNTTVAATSIVLASVANGDNTTEGIAVQRVQPGAGSLVIHVRNTHASSALNGTIVISVVVLN